MLYHTHQLFEKGKGKKKHIHCILVIQNALFIHFNTDDFFFYSWNKISDTQFPVFSSTSNKRTVEYLRVQLRWLRQAQINLKFINPLKIYENWGPLNVSLIHENKLIDILYDVLMDHWKTVWFQLETSCSKKFSVHEKNTYWKYCTAHSRVYNFLYAQFLILIDISLWCFFF